MNDWENTNGYFDQFYDLRHNADQCIKVILEAHTDVDKDTK